MSALKSTLSVFLLICFLSCSVSEDPQSLQPITVHPGDNVTLPCKAPNNTVIRAVEWIRSEPDRLIFFKRDGRLNTADQDPSYVNRVQLKDDEMKNGELSLILNNVNSNDGGTYECLYVEERGYDQIKLSSFVQLNFEEGDSEWKIHKRGHLGVILTVTLIVSALVGFMIFKKLKGRSENKSDLPVDDPDVLQQLQENENSQKNITNNISDTQM
ncbi:titin-like%2C partial [Scomber scombrus]|uniref:Titin-like, partial n=1 Tax=Scomber scombrus TaxID=13677 RepID=A0AAV1Q6G9_SCOSC